MRNTVIYNGWKVELVGKELEVSKGDKTRVYDIKQKNDGIEYDKSMPEYFTINTKNFYYHFKFEEEGIFVGDKYTYDNEHIEEVACWFPEED